MRKLTATLLAACAAGCASGGEPTIVRKPHLRTARAGILPGQQGIPQERDGIHVEDTGAIMFICAESDRHEDKEVFLSKCPGCGELNYFHWDRDRSGFTCFACTKPVEDALIRCPECGRTPRTVRTRPKASK
jgi:Zn finger protein HypA/HybF involved in hydrogenase expression